VKTEEHWYSKIVHQYGRDNLEVNGLKEHMIDIGRKGFVAVQDLVRLITMEMDVQCRNRDVYLIYQRLQNAEQLKFKDMIELICL
jgi:hypothetical protein